MQTPDALHYVVLPTRVGRVLVLMSSRGVVDVVLDSRDARSGDLFSAFRSRFPNTRLIPDDGTHGSWAAAVVARIDGVTPGFVAPIDLEWSTMPILAKASSPAEMERAS